MERRQVLIGTAAFLCMVAAGYYAWTCLRTPRSLSAEQLAEIALTGETLKDKEVAGAALIRMGEPALAQMQRVFRESKTAEVRGQMITGLVQLWDLDSMPAFLAALDDPSPIIRGRADGAVRRVITDGCGYRPEDTPEQRRPAVDKLRGQWDRIRNSPRYPEIQERAKRLRHQPRSAEPESDKDKRKDEPTDDETPPNL
jgi:hypothetical protein